MKALKITGMVVGGLVLFAGIAVLIPWVLSLLWNWLMPLIFGLPEITILQAAGIFILSKILFTPGMGGGKSHSHKKRHNKDSAWKSEFKSKWRGEYDKCRDQEKSNEAQVVTE